MKTSSLLAFIPLAMAVPTTVSKRAGGPAPVLRPRDSQLIADKYIVVLKPGSSLESIEDAKTLFEGDAQFTYASEGLRGFAATLDAEALEAITNHVDVDYVEQDTVVSINTYVSETDAPWGLGRISHAAPGSTTYVYDDSAGAGTCAYVIDTGIYTEHEQFGGRATFLANYVDNGTTDDNGHGTHVSGTIGGSTYGVAKQTSLFAVKVLDSNGSGTTAGVIAGMDFVTTDSQTRSCPNGTVANMSVAGAKTTACNAAAASMIAAGVFVAVAAGNDGLDAANYSPASEPTVCTVGASNGTDFVASFSNYGSLVDIFAPGVEVLSSWIGNTTASATASGTSMATPHIAGLGAYLLTLLGAKTPQALCDYIQSTATSGILTDGHSGTVNLLAFNGNPSG